MPTPDFTVFNPGYEEGEAERRKAHPTNVRACANEVEFELIGRQYSTKVGPIDLYAKAKNGDLVVLELKKGRAADKVFGQICRYMGCIKSEQPNGGAKVRGYIVGREIDEKLRYAAKVLSDDIIGLQTFEFRIDRDTKGWFQIARA